MTKALSKNIIVINEFGLHARPAAMIAVLAGKANSNVWIKKGDEKVDASSIIDIITLACLKGSEITLQIENESDIGIFNEIIDLFEKEFGE